MEVRLAEDFKIGHWNHRVIKHGDSTLELVEAHYDGSDSAIWRLRGYGNPFLTGGNLDELRQSIAWMQRALEKEILLCQCCKHTS